MESLIDILNSQLPITHIIAPLVATITAIVENTSKKHSIRYVFITSILALALGGVIIEYLPEQTVFVAILIGIITGVMTDDLFDKVTSKFPHFLDNVLDIIFTGISDILNRWFSSKNKKDK